MENTAVLAGKKKSFLRGCKQRHDEFSEGTNTLEISLF